MVVLAVAIPTLIGSICSLIGVSLIFVCYIVFPFKTHFRHILVLNLATADFINSLNNTISGIYYIAKASIPTGPACTANGFIGQLSVQGTDFSILLIAIVTVVMLKSPRFLPDSSMRSKVLLSLAVWIVPITTSTIALASKAYGPVSGNWCWIEADRADLRYALTHGWRMCIIITTIGLYAYLFFYFRQVFTLEKHTTSVSMKENAETRKARFRDPESCPVNPETLGELTGDYTVNELVGDFTMDSREDLPPTYEQVQEMESRDLLAAAWVHNYASYTFRRHRIARKSIARPSIESVDTSKTNLTAESGDITSKEPSRGTDFATMNRARNKKIQRALIFNAYPIAYVLLWLPGLINRFVELSTGKSSFALQVLQSSTQFVGLANAITYGFNERVRRRVGNYFKKCGSC
ncbi:hypothetical protein K458DRAFT_371274 [Lentithecium fluviatile CBS 122367]|uniref:G-protein coupled receptors family 1 profile domain-containing protein n=1 Tax=Lentithecium fluviatile CBS 122367 TaxID=1168545 RepID=A0A6G1IVS0_9PLEO|nr:hypothetical protein K458DRAFT_371274 [Lentithecium fluviatile CBS 122367]